jgi:hypothetical protein
MKVHGVKYISSFLIIFSILIIIYSILTKDFNGPTKYRELISLPLNKFVVTFFGIQVPYKKSLLVCFITLGIGIFFLVVNKSKRN